MEAPEKIYLEAIYPDNGVLPNGLNYTPSPTDIEYTRTDAFIEKACSGIEKLLGGYIIRNFHFGDSYDIDRFIEDFKNHMKE